MLPSLLESSLLEESSTLMLRYSTVANLQNNSGHIPPEPRVAGISTETLSDIDDDGDLDYLFAGSSATVTGVVTLENRDGVFRDPVFWTHPSPSFEQLFADFNGDGQLDVFARFRESAADESWGVFYRRDSLYELGWQSSVLTFQSTRFFFGEKVKLEKGSIWS